LTDLFISGEIKHFLLLSRQQLKAHTLMGMEQSTQLLEELGTQALNGTPEVGFDTAVSAIDSITLNDVNEAVSKVLKGKVAIAAVGSVSNVPYQEDLL
jgi:ubiquinol-cytochrome c reductase core subunit 2